MQLTNIMIPIFKIESIMSHLLLKPASQQDHDMCSMRHAHAVNSHKGQAITARLGEPFSDEVIPILFPQKSSSLITCDATVIPSTSTIGE